MRTKKPHKITCNPIFSYAPKSPSLKIASFNTLRKQNKLNNASVANIVNIGEDVPNSIISFSWRLETSSSENLAVIVKTESENPKSFKIVSLNAYR
jgi:hypothetical protein